MSMGLGSTEAGDLSGVLACEGLGDWRFVCASRALNPDTVEGACRDMTVSDPFVAITVGDKRDGTALCISADSAPGILQSYNLTKSAQPTVFVRFCPGNITI